MSLIVATVHWGDQTEEQVQQLRMEVASAKYMQTLYWDKRKSADPASTVIERPAGELLDPATAAQQLAVQQALATGQAPPSPAAVAVASSPGRRSGEPVRAVQKFAARTSTVAPCRNPTRSFVHSLRTSLLTEPSICRVAFDVHGYTGSRRSGRDAGAAGTGAVGRGRFSGKTGCELGNGGGILSD